MIDSNEARGRIGDLVVYQPVGGREEQGTVKSVPDSGGVAFVVYDGDEHAKSTRLEDLTWLHAPIPAAPPVGFVEVVNRYGGFRHYARPPASWLLHNVHARHFTACLGTSSWTVESWRQVHGTDDGHPLGLTPDEMEALPSCPRCLDVVTP